MAIISLTSIPPRFHLLQRTLDSLVAQRSGVTEIRVNIPKSYRRFPEGSFSMPEVPDGVKLVVPEQDYGPATKVLPTLLEFADTEQKIIFCDDDRIAHPDFAQNMVDESDIHPDAIIANSGWDVDKMGVYPVRDPNQVRARRLKSLFDLPYRARRLKQDIGGLFGKQTILKPHRSRNFWRQGMIDILEGAGGVLVKPGHLSPDVFQVPERVWTVDDIWLSGMAAKQGTPIWANNGFIPDEINGAEVDALCNQTIEGLNRAEANLACVRLLQKEHGVWQEAA